MFSPQLQNIRYSAIQQEKIRPHLLEIFHQFTFFASASS